MSTTYSYGAGTSQYRLRPCAEAEFQMTKAGTGFWDADDHKSDVLQVHDVPRETDWQLNEAAHSGAVTAFDVLGAVLLPCFRT